MRGDVQESVRIGVHHLGSIRQVQKGEEEDGQRGRFAVGDHEARKLLVNMLDNFAFTATTDGDTSSEEE
ncbi:hypothetical protein L2E82_38215 [Cichorium intybus]|uniref:Uncharacterized protein n=1 Tax=Cichorium intybus TaxID=13427 RepID=A0ACB9AGP1_CICIN|nr:hypothetical protein L2E82_38215 [Cichorium intybus]